MWQLYEATEYTNPDSLEYNTMIHIHPAVFIEYQDLALELAEICNRHQHQINIHHAQTINNIRVGIPTLAELNSIPTGTDYQAYSISLNCGEQKIRGYIKRIV
jgi:hypothetical protein